MLRNGTPASPAVALASMVLPVPGGPDKMAPFSKNEPRWSVVMQSVSIPLVFWPQGPGTAEGSSES